MALEIDHSQVQAILTDLSGERVLAREQFPTLGESFPQVYHKVCQALDKLLAESPPPPMGWWALVWRSTGWWTSRG